MNLPATPDDVPHAYRLLLGRDPDPGGLEHFNALVRDGSITTTDLSQMFFRSTEFIAKFGRLNGSALNDRPAASSPLNCRACTRRDIDSPIFRYWAERLGLRPGGLHRKAWEWCFITQALYERNVLAAGSRGLGFAVGQEPLTSLFIGMGCEVLATDLDFEHANDEGWVEGNQHAAGLDQLNKYGLCSPELFRARATFRHVDMRAVPEDLSNFDFLWSSCAIEHLGNLQSGLDFVADSLKCLRPGGIAVHTTEFNVDSDTKTVETGHDVIYRKRDFLKLAAELNDHGHHVESFDFDTGDSDADRYVDEAPFTGKVHLKLRIGGFASTSFGLIIRRRVNV